MELGFEFRPYAKVSVCSILNIPNVNQPLSPPLPTPHRHNITLVFFLSQYLFDCIVDCLLHSLVV
jgi:hypothetical protein